MMGRGSRPQATPEIETLWKTQDPVITRQHWGQEGREESAWGWGETEESVLWFLERTDKRAMERALHVG